jgi:hypothetical protein
MNFKKAYDLIDNLTREQVKFQEDIMFKSLRLYAEPPIKGELTKGKIRWRGIRLIQQVTMKGYRTWLEQRGKRISPTIIMEYDNINKINE